MAGRPGSLEAKRARISPSALRKRRAAGEDISGQRALVRVGTTATAILTGEDDLSTWTDEELRQGHKGGRRGRELMLVPKAMHDELCRRLMAKAQATMRDSLMDAVEVLIEIVKGPDFEAKDRLKAVQMIVDRVMGKTPERVELAGEMKPWEVALVGGIVHLTEHADEDDEEDDDADA